MENRHFRVKNAEEAWNKVVAPIAFRNLVK